MVEIEIRAEVLAVAGSPERRALAQVAGAHTVYDHDGWFDAVRAAGGVDVVVDPVGGAAFEQSVRCLAPEGRLVTVGFTSDGAAALRLIEERAVAGKIVLTTR